MCNPPQKSGLNIGPLATTCLLVCCGVISLAACSGRPPKKNQAAEEPAQIYWPRPPDQARFKYEWRLKTVSDVQPPSKDDLEKAMWTGQNPGDQVTFARPGGLAASKGRIYVADGQGAGVVVFDVPRRRVFKFGQRKPHVLTKPIDVAIDGKDRVYVLDVKLKKVLVFDSLGLYLYEVGDAEALVHPAGVAVNQAGDRIYVVDRGTPEGDDHRIHVYDDKGQKQFEIGPRGRAEGKLNIPLDVALDQAGQVYVADSGNFRIQKFTADGKFLSTFGSVGNGIGQFSRPRSIAIGPDDNIYVSDGAFNNVQIFNQQGQLLMPLGGFGIERDMPGKFGLIAGIALDETNRLYVVDQYFNKVEVYRRMP